MNKGSIIYAGGFELPDRNAAAQRVVSNAKIFRELGYNVVLVETNCCQEENVTKHEKCFGFERWSIKSSNKRLVSSKEVKNIIGKYDNVSAVVLYNYPAIAMLDIIRFCKKHRIKVTADVTEWYGVQGDSIIHKVIKGFDSYLRMNWLHFRLDGLIVISQYLNNYYKSKVPCVLLPPLTDLSESKWSKESYFKKDDKLEIVYAGSPGRDKDKLNQMVKAICSAPDWVRLKVIGITLEQFLKYYPEFNGRGFSNKISFLGRVSHDSVIKHLVQANFSLFLRDINRVTMAGFPTKFAEAFTCGVPVITNKTSDLKDYLVEGVNGFWIEDIDKDLLRICENGIDKLLQMKESVDRNTFDYHNYIEATDKWLIATHIQ